MFYICQIFQCDFFGVILIYISYDVADSLNRYLIAVFKIYDHFAVESKQVEYFLQIFDDVNHCIGALSLVFGTFDRILKEYAEKLFLQIVMLSGSGLVCVGPVSCLAQRRKIL